MASRLSPARLRLVFGFRAVTSAATAGAWLPRCHQRGYGWCLTIGLALPRLRVQGLGMRFHVFFSGAMIIALGVSALRVLEKNPGFGFLQGALTLGGGLIICGLFSLKSRWHGIIGAGVLALLGFGRGLGNLPDLLKLAQGDRERGAAPVMELGVTLICLLLLLRVLGALRRERIRRLLEEEE